MRNNDWLKIKGHVGEAKGNFAADKAQRAAAEKSPNSIILTKNEVQGEWDASRVLITLLDGEARAITADDMARFRQKMQSAQRRMKVKGKSGITARQIIDLATNSPLVYGKAFRGKAVEGNYKSDIEKAKREITRSVPASANNDTLRFITNASGNSKRSSHHVVIQLMAFSAAILKLMPTEKKDTASPEKTARWLRAQPLAFDCDCERHRYFLRYVATIGGFAAGRKELGYPKIRNPHLLGVACKHVLRTVSELESSGAVLAFLTRHLQKTINSEELKASTLLLKKEAEKAAQKTSKIKTSAERKTEAIKAKERRALASLLKADSQKQKTQKKSTKKTAIARATEKEETPESLIAFLRSNHVPNEKIMEVLKGLKNA